MKELEKRGAPRVPYISDVVFMVGGKRLSARTSDISATGVFIHSKLWCDPRTMMTLSFPVCSTQIETAGQVRYSIPLIGMGVRFVDLKPEHRAAIEKLIESHDDRDCEELKTKQSLIIPSGVEPVDILLGGLERGHSYLAHGDASGKSLFGVEFLIEGLKRNQPGALITPQRREDAIRRFARVGYNCSDDLGSGALVIITYSNDIVEQIRQRLDLEPLLLELGPVLDESSPERIVFDPVDHLMAGAEQQDAAKRTHQLAAWVRSFGATVVLVSNDENPAVIESLTATVRDAFRFEVRESLDRVVRYLVFEKSPFIPDQAVRVDPSRGIALLEDQQPDERLRQVPEGIGEVDAGDGYKAESIAENDSAERTQYAETSCATVALESDSGSSVVKGEEGEAFFAMLDELQSFVSSFDPDEDAPANRAVLSEPVFNRFPEPGPTELSD
jgi:KaiC/GvpD/RAD55 family RecA-like ATPase